jgi:hypothetical protein
MADAANREDWQILADAINNEADSERLLELVGQLCDALDCAKSPLKRADSGPDHRNLTLDA